MSTIALDYCNRTGKKIYFTVAGTTYSLDNGETSATFGDCDPGCSNLALPPASTTNPPGSRVPTLTLSLPGSDGIAATVNNPDGTVRTGNWGDGITTATLYVETGSGGLIVGVIDPGGEGDTIHS